MDYLWLIQEIFTVIIIPLLSILTVFVIKCVNSYSDKLQAETDNQLIRKYIGMLNDIITVCVIATNQTYVNSLKDQNKFDMAAQKKAFDMTYNAVKDILTDEMVSVLSEIYEDLDQYIKNQIEFLVSRNKTQYERYFNNDDFVEEVPMDYNYEEN